ncbi:MAG TPA: lipopolysaccharide heptosyltransferase I [Chlamydiales bacterium]|jgi:heptosyltransferase-1|nr:lipopolysaccharide heptosyltransferase I [Chlamydiales bacterium]
MKRILLVKLTSLGDLIHALPALTDAKAAYPDLVFDWVIDENFQEVAAWHPAIGRTFTTNHRKWRKNLLASCAPIYGLVKSIRETDYDLILDGQGNFKSALISLLAKGVRAGFDRHSVRESIAQFVYQKKYSASWQLHAIDRLRHLFSAALGYPLPTTLPDFGIQQERFAKPSVSLPRSFFLFIHSATWETKLWPEAHWIELIRKVDRPVLLPWGTPHEKERAIRLAAATHATVLPKLTLSEIGYIVAHAKGCVSVDTGLSHLAAALKVPSVTIYGSTDAGLIGASGQGQIRVQAARFCAPCQRKRCRYRSASLNPPCTAEITPDVIFENLLKIAGLYGRH